MRVKVIIFDLDDTLYNEKTFVQSGFYAVSEYFIPKNPHAMYTKMLHILEEQGRGKVFDSALKEFDIYSKTNVKKALTIYRTHKPNIKLNDDAEEILTYYQKHNVPLYIVTDGNKLVQANKIKALNLDNRVKKAFITHRYSRIHSKPSPFCFQKIAQIEGVMSEDIVYIADNVNKDFVGIKKLGFHTIRIRQGMFKDVQKAQKFEAHKKIESLRELKKLLKVRI